MKRVTNDAVWERHVRFAPDGKRIAYLVMRGLETFVMVKPFPDGDARDVGRGDDLAWSPDGSRLASRDDKGVFLSIKYCPALAPWLPSSPAARTGPADGGFGAVVLG